MNWLRGALVLVCVSAAACSSNDGPPSEDAGRRDTGSVDAAASDTGAVLDSSPGEDAPSSDDGGAGEDAPSTADAATDSGPGSDAGDGHCDPMDVTEGEPCGPTERPAPRWHWDGNTCAFSPWCRCLGADCEDRYNSEAECERAHSDCAPAGSCRTDAECTSGEAWCEDGACEVCDNSGLVCRIACPEGWSVYRRNGCSPCACAPINDCESDSDCERGECYAGAFCWDWCPPGDPSCCFGNQCSAAGCEDPHPGGCHARGCPRGESCVDRGCASSTCGCSSEGGLWICTDDCGGGTCVADATD